MGEASAHCWRQPAEGEAGAIFTACGASEVRRCRATV